MCEITYNAKIEFETKDGEAFWYNVLSEARDMFNFASKEVFNKNPKLKQKDIADLIYYPIRRQSKYLNSQCVCKIEREILSTFRSIKSNGHKIESEPIKNKLSLRLDKRLYSKFNKDGIYLTSNVSMKRCKATIKLYPKIIEMFDSYRTSDPLIYVRNNEFYLSIPFKVPDKVKQNEYTLGIDLGCRRLITTSNGDVIKSNDFLRQKRKIRYLKRILNSKKKSSHSARTKLKSISNREKNFSKQYIEKSVNLILQNTKEDIIAIEDLTKIKKKTYKKYGSHNNRISQIPFYMFKQILTYKATLCGKEVKTVSPAYTSQIDCSTNKRDGKRQGCRYYSTNGYVFDADWNASINIKNRAENVKHLISYNKLPLDGTLNILNKQVVVNQPIVNLTTSNSQAHTLLGCE
ncbi:MAG: transposase [Paludibacteraceae bacterium]|nr:transposase [Paludibacteraceae bacterium]